MKLRDRVAQLEADLADAELRLEEFRTGFDVAVRRAVESRLDELLADPDKLRAATLDRISSATSQADLMGALRSLAVLDRV